MPEEGIKKRKKKRNRAYFGRKDARSKNESREGGRIMDENGRSNERSEAHLSLRLPPPLSLSFFLSLSLSLSLGGHVYLSLQLGVSVNSFLFLRHRAMHRRAARCSDLAMLGMQRALRMRAAYLTRNRQTAGSVMSLDDDLGTIVCTD